MTAVQQINSLRSEFKKLYDNLPAIVGGKAVTFFKENFRRQGWPENGNLKRWKPRAEGASRNTGRGLLMDTGRLRRSIRIVKKGPGYVIIGSDVPYAKAHNEGISLSKTVRVRPHIRNTRRGKQEVSSHTRKMNVTIPQRQFLGESEDVLKSVEREVIKHIESIVAKISQR